jgi:adenine-specific DNA-methyltransferase
VAVQLNPRGRTLDKYLAKTHEYIGAFAIHGGDEAIHEIAKSEAMLAEYNKVDDRGQYRELELRNRNPVFDRSNRPNLYYPIYIDPKDGTASLIQTDQYSQQVTPINSKDEDGCWTWGREKALKNIAEVVGRQVGTGAWRVFRKDRLLDDDGSVATTKAKSIWIDKAFNNENGKELVQSLFGAHVFAFPKPVALIEQCIRIGSDDEGLFMDYFAGSGTSGHAVINLNREDDGHRKYILMEMGAYFDTVLRPRLQKVIYSNDWKDGKPVSRVGSSHMFKYLRLESYEDTLNNLELQRASRQLPLLDSHDASAMREEYMLHYMIDVESHDSLLPLERFAEPFGYQLKIATSSAGESRPTTVDLVETFNLLLGLRVHRMWAVQGVRAVMGLDPSGSPVLVLWRSLSAVSNTILEGIFERAGLHEIAATAAIVFVNGDNTLAALRGPDETWSVRLIEEEFKRRMFDMQDM